MYCTLGQLTVTLEAYNGLKFILKEHKLPTARILSGKNARAFLVCGFLMKSFKKKILKIWKKSWEPFGSYLLNSTANPAHFHPNWAGLATSKRLLGFFFRFSILIFIHFLKHKTIFPLNISAVGTVTNLHS